MEHIEETKEKIMMERKVTINALIIRLMKQEKKMKHLKLVNQVLEILDLPLTGKDLQKCIDDCISKDFIKRDDNDYELYIYIP